MLQIVPTCAVGVTILLCISYTESAFNWDHLGGPPPEIEEPIAYETVPTAQPTPRWAKRIRDFLKTNRPRHPVEMLFPSNETALAEEHKQIKANMTKDPSWAWRRFEELKKLKGTTVDQIPDNMKNFTFPDMNIGTYDCSKTDEEFNKYLDKVTIESDYDKLKAKYDPYDIVNNKSIDWGHPTYDDEEFDNFVKDRIGRLLLNLYSFVNTEVTSPGTMGSETRVVDMLRTIDTLTRAIVTHIDTQRDTGLVFKHYFLDNVLIECDKLETSNLIAPSFSNLIKSVVKQLRRFHLNQIEILLEKLAHNHEPIFQLVNSLLLTDFHTSEQKIQQSVETLFANVLNPLIPSVKKFNLAGEQNADSDMEGMIKSRVGTSSDMDDRYEINTNSALGQVQDRKNPISSSGGRKRKISQVNQINNVVNIFINKPHSYHKKRRSVMETTTYLPPWDFNFKNFPDLNIEGISSDSGTDARARDFYAKKREAYEAHMKRKLFLPNNHSVESFIFETFEYENPNKTRKAVKAQRSNIEAMKEKSNRLRQMRQQNETYQQIYNARRNEHLARQKAKQEQKNKPTDVEQTKPSHNKNHESHKKIHKNNEGSEIRTTPELRNVSIQDITNVECWFKEADIYYSRVQHPENKLTTTSKSTDKSKPRTSVDESYERYKRRKERRRKHKDISRHDSSSSDDRSRSRSSKSSCQHCKRRRHRKHRKHSKSSDSETDSESSRRDRKRKRKQKRSSESSASRKHHSSDSYNEESLERHLSELSREDRKNKNKKSSSEEDEEPTTPLPSTTTKRKSTKKLDSAISALDEPSESLSDVPSHELTSWHYWKEWSLHYFMHPNISDYNISTYNVWKTTYPWTTRKVRVTKYKYHPNITWPTMSDSDSGSSQDSYNWGSGQSWIQNQKREMKSVEHFVRDNFFSEINEAGMRLQSMNITGLGGKSQEEDLELSENEDRMADFSARYRQDFRKLKEKEREKAREYERWSKSGGNYSTTTEFDWEIKITKNYSQRSFRKGGHDIVFDISGLTFDPLSIEQIEKNLDADYLWKHGKNRTKITTRPTTVSTTSTTTTTTTTTTTKTTPTQQDNVFLGNEEETSYEEGKSIINSDYERMTSEERKRKIANFEKNFDQYEQVGRTMFVQDMNRKKRDTGNRMKSLIEQVLENKITGEDLYVKNKKAKMLYLHEMPKLSPPEIRNKELALESQLNNFLETQHQIKPQVNFIRNNRRKLSRHVRRIRRGAAPQAEEKKKDEEIPYNEANFNQRAHPDHPVFILTQEDIETGRYKTYNMSFVNDKFHEYLDEMFEECKLNHDTSEEEKNANSIYYRKYLQKRTTAFFDHLKRVIMGGNKRELQEFTYPPDYDFGAASLRDPEKEPYLMQLKNEYRQHHAASIEALERDIELAKQGKLNTASWRREADEHVRNLPDDEN